MLHWNTKFKHVNYLWDTAQAEKLGSDEVALLVYRSNLLGADLRLTNYGGGNTSCKTIGRDPLTGEEVPVMYVKGSGGDLGSMTKSGLAALYLDRLTNLERIYRGIEHEDEMVELLNHCIFDLNSKPPSIDTPLHGFLPYKHIDHLHPDAVIAIAASKDGPKIAEELFSGAIGWVEWQRPGFDLGLKLRNYVRDHPQVRGLILKSHGLFTWGETSYECYLNSLEVVERCAEYLDEKIGKSPGVFGGIKVKPIPKDERRRKAAWVAPVLRGYCSSQTKMVGHFNDSDAVLEFVNSKDIDRLAEMGTSCPDHFLRTKIKPLVLDLDPSFIPGDVEGVSRRIGSQFEGYRKMYSTYYEECKHPDSPAIRDPNPVVILLPGIGMFTFAKDKQTARVAAEFYVNAINVMKGAEAISEYVALPRQEAFNIEYWALEEAKLARRPKAKPLTGRVGIITGGAGGIGKAIAKKFAEEGACVVICDNDEERLKAVSLEFQRNFGPDSFITGILDVTEMHSVRRIFDEASLAFGGVDIIVNCAGLSISKPLEEHTERDWDIQYDVMVKGQFLVTQKGVELMRKQGFGGDVLNIVSKNALVSGPNNAAYGSAKAAQLHLSRLNAAELGKDKIRVNVINPDAVITDSQIWSGAWAEGRAKAYGIRVDELPAYYAKRTLLNETINPEDIANACFVFVSGLLNKSTGNVLNVDGGIPAAFVR
jgi:rhamnulose-1-phosphate aldolase/alcohol dehydrogenase